VLDDAEAGQHWRQRPKQSIGDVSIEARDGAWQWHRS